MPDKTFLETFGLYRKFSYSGSTVLIRLPSPSLQLYCAACKGERTWYEDIRQRLRIGPRPDSSDYDVREPGQDIAGCHVGLRFLCAGCNKAGVQFILRFANETKTGVMKVGQSPPWSIDIPPDVRAALGGREEIYKRGSICESQGYGIGAFAYYRRIVEDMIDDLLRDIGNLLEPADRTKYQAALNEVGETIVAAEKIEVVKDLLPASLRPGGVNPLQLLHDALSVGIHELDEDECLTFAEAIRQSLGMLCKHVALHRQDMQVYGAGMRSVKEKLDKRLQRAAAKPK